MTVPTLRQFLDQPGPSLPDRWNPWRFNRANLALTGPSAYEIDLERIDSPAEVLDWIFQVAGKCWGPKALPGLVAAFRDLLYLGVERYPDAPALFEAKAFAAALQRNERAE